jgi:hypothetical protein
MPEFRRIKFQATLESEVMLLPEREIKQALDGIYDRLRVTGLSIVSVEPEEVVTAPGTVVPDYRD